MLKNYSLLYVEDNSETSRAFIGAFAEYFKEVHVAKDGEEGLILFEKNSPDIVLTDIQMPKIGGLEMIARMRESSPNIPIVVNSAFSDTHLLLKAIALHVDDYILKPTNPVLLLGTLKKIAHILTLEKKLDDSHKMMQTIMDEIPDPILYILPDYTVSMMNKAAKDLNDEGANETFPQCHKISNQTSGACTNDHQNCPVEHVSKTKQPSTIRHIHTDMQGKKHHVDIHAKPIFDSAGNIIAYLEIRHDISAYLDIQNQLINETKKLTHISMHDSLTHLPNRRLLADRIRHTIAKKSRSNEIFALFFIDLDHFKEINDSLGHLVGDQLLVQVAKRIQKAIRKGDTIARNGGDEFVLIVDNGDSNQHFISVAEKILELFKAPFVINHEEVFSSCSIGISIYPKDGKTSEELLKNSDAAMYGSKQAGRNQFAFYSSN